MIPTDFIQTLLARVDIVDVIDRSVPLKKAGANYQACCPFHSEKTPSFTVSPTKQFYHCFGCGAHGTAIGFLMEHDGKSFPEAVEDARARRRPRRPARRVAPANASGATRPSTCPKRCSKPAKFYRARLKDAPRAIALSEAARPHRRSSRSLRHRLCAGRLAEPGRGVSGVSTTPQLDAAGLVIAGDGGKRYDRFRDRMMFPIHDTRGRVIGFGGRVLGRGRAQIP